MNRQTQKKESKEPKDKHFKEAAHAKEELKKVIDYIQEIFKEVGCETLKHVTPAVSLCTVQNCNTHLLCNECLTEDLEHTTEHKTEIVPLQEILSKIFLHNMEDYVIKDYKMVEVTKFYELFWRGVKMFYRERYEKFVDDIRDAMKTIIDGFTEIVVKTKNSILEKFDSEMRNLKKMIDEGMNVITKFNSFNVDKVVKDILGFCAADNTQDLTDYLRACYQSKVMDDLYEIPIRLYRNIKELKEEIDFNDYTPTVTFNKEKITNSLINIFRKGINNYVKYIGPKKKLSYDALKNETGLLAEKGLRGIGGSTNAKTYAGNAKEVSKKIKAQYCTVVVRNSKRVQGSYEYQLNKFEKLSREFNLGKFLKGKSQYLFTRQSDKKNLRKVLFKKMFPEEKYDKRWTMTVNLPQKKKFKLADDDAMSMVSLGQSASNRSMEGESLQI